MKHLPLLVLLSIASCITYDAETEQKFLENQAFMTSYMEEIGFANSPFVEPISEKSLDKQRKKYLALLSHEELRKLIDNRINGIPRIEDGTERSKAYFLEIEGLEDLQQCYDILNSQYPDIIIKK